MDTTQKIFFTTISVAYFGICAMMAIWSYLYIKHHVFIERRIIRFFRQKIGAKELCHQHKTNSKFHSCRIWVGHDYFNPRPHTIPCDLTFPQLQNIQSIFELLISLLKVWKYDIIKQSFDSIVIQKGKYVFRITIIPLKDEASYRFIFTWIPFNYSPALT